MPLGASGALSNMLRRSLGAGSLAGFWRYWNPIWGYYLGRSVYRPLRRLAPRPVALLTTFVASGAIHDVAATLVTRSLSVLVTPWFFFLGLGVLFGGRLDYSKRPFALRVAIHVAYVSSCLALAWLALRLTRR